MSSSFNLFIFLFKVLRARTTTCFIDQTEKVLRVKGDTTNDYTGTTGLNWDLTEKAPACYEPPQSFHFWFLVYEKI